MRLSVGVPRFLAPVHGMVDTQPLREYLCQALGTSDGRMTGIHRNIAAGKLQGVALATNAYATSETVTFFQGREIKAWERPNRRSVETELNVEHVMASSALPLLFPPVRIGDQWYGDGGVRLIAPLAPAIHMGADRMIVISTHYIGAAAPQPLATEAPSPATVLASMYNSVFLDQLDHDVHHMNRTNRLVRNLPPVHREGLREIGLLTIRPSVDLGALAFEMRDRVPFTFRYLLDRFGGNQPGSDDLTSTMLFHRDYIERLIEIGEQDGQAQAAQIAEFVAP
jgi:NTE family protein